MAIQKQFEEFYDKIKLTTAQKEDAKTKYEGVSKALHNYYYPTIEYSGNTKLLIGSYGKHTNIRPPRDIDVIFIMPPEKFAQYDDNTSNKQAQLLQDVRKILSERYTTTDKITADGKVVLVEFAGSTHSVEVLPAWQEEDGTFKIPNSEDGGSWDYWDPRAGIEKIKKSNNDNNQKTIPLIRMIKKWSENCTITIKSFQIEESVLNFISPANNTLDYSVMARDFFQHLAKMSFETGISSHAQTAFNRAAKACDFEAGGNLEEAADEWKKVFGEDFPKGGLVEEVAFTFSEQIADLQQRYPSPKEQYLDKDYGIPTEINPSYSVKIDALIIQYGFRNKRLSEYLREKLRIAKLKSMTFQILRNSVPQPCMVKWKVRNFGEEAKIAEDLRGEIRDDEGYGERKEGTKYKGEHYVECYVIKDGKCVATDNILVPIN